MERLRGPINPFLVDEEIKPECLKAESTSSLGREMTSYRSLLVSHHHMPFLQLLQGAMRAEEKTEGEALLHLRLKQGQQQEEQEQHQSFFTSSSYLQESNFQLLLRLQSHQKQYATAADVAEVERSRGGEQLDSCITHASESEAREAVHHHPTTTTKVTAAQLSSAGSRERKKRKRSRVAAAAAKSPEEVESQRMTHIAVERNRRRLMNDHLATLRSLMPPYYIQRGDQASIIGGAIEFVKELEQYLLSLQAEKLLRTSAEAAVAATNTSSKASSSRRAVIDDDGDSLFHVGEIGFFVSPQYTSYSQSLQRKPQHRARQRSKKKLESAEEEMLTGVDVEATVVQRHVNLKVAGRRRSGQLERAIAAMEKLRLSVIHLNITSLDHHTVLYALNLKMEEECRLESADEIATLVHQIFSYINAC